MTQSSESFVPPQHEPVQSRNETFSEKIVTRIWCETAAPSNPYIAEALSCYGYDLFALMEKRSFVDVFFLLFRGELPSPDEARLLEHLMIALISPGLRHPATRAAMCTGVGKTDPLHILPIASGILGGSYLGGGEIEAAIKFLRRTCKQPPQDFLLELVQARTQAQNLELPAGFGKIYGGVDPLAQRLGEHLAQMPAASTALSWGREFSTLLCDQSFGGWLRTGVAAAVFSDLGFQPRAGGCLFQLLGAPGLVAQGLEMANKPITAFPFVKDENYVIER